MVANGQAGCPSTGWCSIAASAAAREDNACRAAENALGDNIALSGAVGPEKNHHADESNANA
jgi:hypothetical protein